MIILRPTEVMRHVARIWRLNLNDEGAMGEALGNAIR